VKNFPAESYLNAELRRLTDEVRALREEIRGQCLGSDRAYHVVRARKPLVVPTQPVSEERKLRLIPYDRRKQKGELMRPPQISEFPPE